MAARVVGRPVRLALARQHQFSVVGYRTPTIQRIRLGAGADGVLRAISHEVIEQTSTVREFAEQTAVGTRMMYAAAARRTAHKLARLDVPTPAWMRAPGEAPGMYALESALDELAVACGLDPIELRVRNEPAVDPESGTPVLQPQPRRLPAGRGVPLRLVRPGPAAPGPAGRALAGRHRGGRGDVSGPQPAGLGRGADAARRPVPGGHQRHRHRHRRPYGARPGRRGRARGRAGPDRDVRRRLDAAAGEPRRGSMGTASWSWAVDKAARELRARMAAGVPEGGLEVSVDTADDVAALDAHWSRHAFGAHFAEVRVDADTGEVPGVPAARVYAVGRVVNPTTARSQFLGGMTMGLGMALTEESTMDHRFGDYVNDDFAGYHVPACADVGTAIEAYWLDEQDRYVNPLGIKGIGEIGIVGVPAAIGNAVWHATGVRVADLPIRLDKVLFR
jgi:xanthine dehydrogenase YagR molybdenum-binding subunit